MTEPRIEIPYEYEEGHKLVPLPPGKHVGVLDNEEVSGRNGRGGCNGKSVFVDGEPRAHENKMHDPGTGANMSFLVFTKAPRSVQPQMNQSPSRGASTSNRICRPERGGPS